MKKQYGFVITIAVAAAAILLLWGAKSSIAWGPMHGAWNKVSPIFGEKGADMVKGPLPMMKLRNLRRCLSVDTRDKIFDILKQKSDDFIEKRIAMQTLVEDYIDILTAAEVDQDALQAVQDNIIQQKNDNLVFAFDLAGYVRDALTPEELNELAVCLED